MTTVRHCSFRSYRLHVAIALVALSVVPGCGDSDSSVTIVPISGKVTFEGTPVKGGSIAFANDEGGMIFRADFGSDGSYALLSQHGTGIPPGNYKVSIAPPTPSDEPDPENDPVAQESEDIPKKYRDFSTSGLTADVKEGGGTFDFDMKP